MMKTHKMFRLKDLRNIADGLSPLPPETGRNGEAARGEIAFSSSYDDFFGRALHHRANRVVTRRSMRNRRGGSGTLYGPGSPFYDDAVMPDDSPNHDPALNAALRLSLVPGVGPLIRKALVVHFGSAEKVLAATGQQLKEVSGVGAKLAGAIKDADDIDVELELSLCREHGIEIIVGGDACYPRMLTEIHDPPALLYARGEIHSQDNVAIGIVGSRHATAYGRKIAEQLAAGLSRAGCTIVSGLARGIDGAAHRGALDAGGRTIAVLASGLLEVYPPEHKELSVEVAASGAIISEAPPRGLPLAGAFPQRNRIISGLSLGVIIVEATERSGALITARHAMEQGREVFAVPGRVDQRTSRGCHRLIRDGARLVESIDDVLEELGPLVEATSVSSGTDERTLRHPAELKLNELETKVLDAIETEPTSIDAIVSETSLPVARVLSTISVLEMRSLIRRVSGNLVARR